MNKLRNCWAISAYVLNEYNLNKWIKPANLKATYCPSIFCRSSITRDVNIINRAITPLIKTISREWTTQIPSLEPFPSPLHPLQLCTKIYLHQVISVDLFQFVQEKTLFSLNASPGKLKDIWKTVERHFRITFSISNRSLPC